MGCLGSVIMCWQLVQQTLLGASFVDQNKQAEPPSVELSITIRGKLIVHRVDKKTEAKEIRITTSDGLLFYADIEKSHKLYPELDKFVGKTVRATGRAFLDDPPKMRTPPFFPVLSIFVEVTTLVLEEQPKK